MSKHTLSIFPALKIIATSVLVLPFALLVQPADAQIPEACNAAIEEMFEYVGRNSGNYYLATYARTAIRNGLYSSHSNRSFNMILERGGRNIISGKMVEKFPYSRNPDDFNETTVKLYRDGRGEIILNTWGNATFPVRFTGCTNGRFVTIQGTYLEGHPTFSTFSISFWPTSLI